MTDNQIKHFTEEKLKLMQTKAIANVQTLPYTTTNTVKIKFFALAIHVEAMVL